jgi:hypothetical protein
MIEIFNSLKNVIILNNSIPAELYLINLTRSIIVSGWSTALMYYNPNNKYFYTYNFYKNLDDNLMKQLVFQGFPHVKMVNNLNEIFYE